MTSFCIGVSLVGLIAAFFLPFAVMVFLMITGTTIGAVIFAWHGASAGSVILLSLLCLFCVQMGYAAGIVICALVSGCRSLSPGIWSRLAFSLQKKHQ